MPPTDRLREHPHDRLSLPAQRIDLGEAASRLSQEAHPPVDGHRQSTIFRHCPVTAVLFVFEAGGALKEHWTDGVVTIHTLSGRLVVTAEGESHELGSGQLLALAPRVPHTVASLERSRMLLTISRCAA